MGLKAILKTMDGIPEEIQGLYKKQKDDLFVLDVDEMEGWALQNVTGLRNALSSEKEDRRRAFELSQQHEKTIEDLSKKLEAKTSDAPQDVQEAVAAAIADVNKEWQGKFDGLRGEYDGKLEKRET